MQKIKIKYFTDKIEPLDYIEGKSDWIDMRASEEVTLKAGEFALIPLGVAMELPKGYEAHLVPRSSTFKNKQCRDCRWFLLRGQRYVADAGLCNQGYRDPRK